jgi:hypothetical protein
LCSGRIYGAGGAYWSTEGLRRSICSSSPIFTITLEQYRHEMESSERRKGHDAYHSLVSSLGELELEPDAAAEAKVGGRAMIDTCYSVMTKVFRGREKEVKIVTGACFGTVKMN